MTRCLASRPKKRTQRGRGKSVGYKHGMKGHHYEKLYNEIYQDTDSGFSICVGRKCGNCGKVFLNPTGVKFLS